jgi:purine-binding chemotaxis protein CheW
MSRIRPRAPDENIDEKAREILRQRAQRLRGAVQAQKDEAIDWVAEFPVGDERYAIPLSTLRAAVPLRRVTPVPLSRPHVVGIVRFQGQIVTALSMASLLGIKGWGQDPAVLLVIDPGWSRLVALDCEEIPRPVGLSSRALEEARARDSGAVIEVVHDNRIVHVVDLAAVLSRRTGGRDG